MKSRPGKRPESLPIRRVPVHELFPQPGQYRPVETKKVPRQRAPFPKQNLIWGLVFLSFVITGFGLFGLLRRSDAQAPFVLLDVRAIEQSGHPVTAATVTINSVDMGVTDSFGEWRRYLRFQAGDKVKIELTKNGENPLVGNRVVTVPARKGSSQDIEVRASIELRGLRDTPKRVAKKEEREVQEEIQEPEPENMDEAPKDLRIGEEKARASDDLLGIENEVGDTNDKSLGIYFDDGLSRIAVSVAPFRGGSGSLMEKRQSGIIQERVLPLLVNELQTAGLGVDRSAPWKLNLSFIAQGDHPGYIKADISWQNPFGQSEKSSFIAGFAKTYEETSRGIASLLRVHMKKTYWAFKEDGNWFIDESNPTNEFWRMKASAQLTDTSGEKFSVALVAQNEGTRRWKLRVGNTQPCAAVRQRSRCMVSTESLKETAPLKGWTLRRMRFNGAMPKGSDVYVSGFQAYPVGNGQYEYWGHSGSTVKALVIANNRLLHSETITDSPGNIAMVRLPAGRQARR